MDENENLYGSVGPKEIVKGMKEMGVELNKKEIMMADMLRVAGEHTINLRLHSDVTIPFKIALIPADSS